MNVFITMTSDDDLPLPNPLSFHPLPSKEYFSFLFSFVTTHLFAFSIICTCICWFHSFFVVHFFSCVIFIGYDWFDTAHLCCDEAESIAASPCALLVDKHL